jgi:hypothetical protein
MLLSFANEKYLKFPNNITDGGRIFDCIRLYPHRNDLRKLTVKIGQYREKSLVFFKYLSN